MRTRLDEKSIGPLSQKSRLGPHGGHEGSWVGMVIMRYDDDQLLLKKLFFIFFWKIIKQSQVFELSECPNFSNT